METYEIIEKAEFLARNGQVNYAVYERFKAQLIRENLPDSQYQRELQRLAQVTGL